MSARSKARGRALDILYESDMRRDTVASILADHERRREAAGQPPLRDLTRTVALGVEEHHHRIDHLIRNASVGWDLDRMPSVDRNALRIGVFEMMWLGEVPDKVAISEAVALVRNLSTDESPRFVEGVLGRILRDKDSEAADSDESESRDPEPTESHPIGDNAPVSADSQEPETGEAGQD